MEGAAGSLGCKRYSTEGVAQCMQVVSMAVLSICWLGAAAILEVEQSAPLSSLWQGYGDPLAWLVLLWPAIGQYSTGEAAQVAGQAKCALAPLTHTSSVLVPDTGFWPSNLAHHTPQPVI